MMRRCLLILLMLAISTTGVWAQDNEPTQENSTVPRAGNPHGPMELDCKICHAESSWDVSNTSSFDHASTGFELEGLHRYALCRDCHREPVFAHIGTQCADCHNDTHRGRLGPACSDCHTPKSWVDQPKMRQDHNATALPLVGAHERVDCDACHAGAAASDYVGTPTECYACHADVYAATTAPNHQQAHFDTDCERCHGVFSSSWGAGDFNHNLLYPLNGAHRVLDCMACHSDGFAGTPTTCIGCHQSEYDTTANPGHVEAGFPTNCIVCHSESAWLPATYDHNTTGFPLTGAHRGPDCLACHSTGYTGISSECASCHQTDYNNTTDPAHLASGIPLDCQVCHGNVAWTPADYDHNLTAFPLTGAHVPLDCLSCHDTGYAGTPTDCAACHQADYNNTSNPNHLASNFPTSCQECHSTTAWEPSSWDHNSLFPIDSGAHSNVWDSCTTCHVVPTDFSVFECIDCHEHNRTDMDNDHKDEGDYQYLSSACFECHPRGTH